jgi:hypothetical protein
MYNEQKKFSISYLIKSNKFVFLLIVYINRIFIFIYLESLNELIFIHILFLIFTFVKVNQRSSFFHIFLN